MSQQDDTDDGYIYDDGERDPKDLAANGFRPVWTSYSGYPGESPADIAELIELNSNRTCRLIGPLSSLFWLGKYDNLVDAIESDEFTVQDSIGEIPINWSIRGTIDLFCHEGRANSFIVGLYDDPPAPSLWRYPVPRRPIPTCVTEVLTPQKFRHLFPYSQSEGFPNEVLTIRMGRHEVIENLAQMVPQNGPDHGTGDLLFRGLNRTILNSSMACFFPISTSNGTDHEFGPGIYTTTSLELALVYAGLDSAIKVFQDTGFQDTGMENCTVWEPSIEEWRNMIRFWSGRGINIQNEAPPGWTSDFIRGAVSEVEGQGRSLVPSSKLQVVEVSYQASIALAQSLKMIVWID